MEIVYLVVSISPLGEQHHSHGAQDDLQVQQDVLVAQVVVVQDAHVVEADVAPARDLPQAGQAR